MWQTWKFRTAGVGLLIGSLVLLALTSTTNWVQGINDGVTESGRLINSSGSVAVDVMGLLFCGMAVGICIGIRKWGWATIFGLGLVLSAVWSGYSVYSFRASEQISASTTRETANSRIADADRLQAESARKTITAATSARFRTARKDFIEANQEAIKSFRDAPVQVIVPPDAGAETIATRLGWKLETVQTVKAAFFSFLIIFLKMIGFPGAGFLLSWSPEAAGSISPSKEASRSISSSSKRGNGSDGGNDDFTDKSNDKLPESEDEIVLHRPAQESPSARFHAAPVTLQDEIVGQQAVSDHLQSEIVNDRLPPSEVRSEPARVERAAPKPSLHLTIDDLPKYIASLKAGTALPINKHLAETFGTSEPTMSRRMKRMEGRGEVERKKVGRTVQTIVLPRRDRGGLYAGA